MSEQQSDLFDRLRVRLAHEPVVREVRMFAGRALMVDDKLLVSAHKDGSLLVRVAAGRHDELTSLPGASTGVMGAGRSMGPGWIMVSSGSIDTDERLAFWVDAALEHNRAAAGERASSPVRSRRRAARGQAPHSPG